MVDLVLVLKFQILYVFLTLMVFDPCRKVKKAISVSNVRSYSEGTKKEQRISNALVCRSALSCGKEAKGRPSLLECRKSRKRIGFGHVVYAMSSSSAALEPRPLSALEKVATTISSAFPLFVLGAAIIGLKNPSSFSFFSSSFMTPALGYVVALCVIV